MPNFNLNPYEEKIELTEELPYKKNQLSDITIDTVISPSSNKKIDDKIDNILKRENNKMIHEKMENW